MGVLPQKFFCFNCVKSCNSGQEQYENALLLKQGVGSWILFIIWIWVI